MKLSDRSYVAPRSVCNNLSYQFDNNIAENGSKFLFYFFNGFRRNNIFLKITVLFVDLRVGKIICRHNCINTGLTVNP